MNWVAYGWLALAVAAIWGAVVGLLVYGLGDVPYEIALMAREAERDHAVHYQAFLSAAGSGYVVTAPRHSLLAQAVIWSHDWGGNLPVIAGAAATAAMLVALPTLYCAGPLTLRVWRFSMTCFAPSRRRLAVPLPLATPGR